MSITLSLWMLKQRILGRGLVERELMRRMNVIPIRNDQGGHTARGRGLATGKPSSVI